MKSEVLLDANVLVYAIDPSAGARHEVARRVVAAAGGRGASVSTQVLSEYANVATHPRKLALDDDVVSASVRRLAQALQVHAVGPATVIYALGARARWRLAFYDAQIWAAAALAGIPVVLSEDFADGLRLGPVRFVNPFVDGFDLEAVLDNPCPSR